MSPEEREGANGGDAVAEADPNDDSALTSLLVAYDPNDADGDDDDDDDDDDDAEGEEDSDEDADLLVSGGKGWWSGRRRRSTPVRRRRRRTPVRRRRRRTPVRRRRRRTPTRVRPHFIDRVRNRYITVPKVINRNVIKFKNVYRTQHVPVVRTTYRTRVIRRTIRKQAAIARAEIENDVRHVRLCKRIGASSRVPAKVIRDLSAVKRRERAGHIAHLRAVAAMMRARARALRTRAARLRARKAETRVVRERRVIERHYVPNSKHITTNHHHESKSNNNVHIHLGGPNLDELRRDVRDATRGVLEDFYASLARKRSARRKGQQTARPSVP